MAISMHAASVPLFTQMLSALSDVLNKGSAFAATKSFDPTVLLSSRLAPDMFPLSRQVQIATDMSKGCIARLAGIEIPAYADDEATIDDLKARIAKTIAFLESVKPEQIDGSADRDITITLRRGDMHFKGLQYLVHWTIPNFTFHCATAYDILRHNGVEIGKRDFIGM